MDNKVIVEQLGNILNALSMIETSGKNTLIMADCLRALDEVHQLMQQNQESDSERSNMVSGPTPVDADMIETTIGE